MSECRLAVVNGQLVDSRAGKCVRQSWGKWEVSRECECY